MEPTAQVDFADDKAQWVFESGVFKTYVSADEVE